MTPNEFREMALALPGAEERSHMGHPDFRVNGKIFAGVGAPGQAATVKLPPEHQAMLSQRDSAAFSPASGAWGRSGWTSILLASADPETVGEALTIAWRTVSAPQAKKVKKAR